MVPLSVLLPLLSLIAAEDWNQLWTLSSSSHRLLKEIQPSIHRQFLRHECPPGISSPRSDPAILASTLALLQPRHVSDHNLWLRPHCYCFGAPVCRTKTSKTIDFFLKEK